MTYVISCHPMALGTDKQQIFEEVLGAYVVPFRLTADAPRLMRTPATARQTATPGKPWLRWPHDEFESGFVIRKKPKLSAEMESWHLESFADRSHRNYQRTGGLE